MSMNSSEVSAGDAINATDHNQIRDDILTHAGDYAAAGGSSNAYTLSLDSDLPSYTAGMIVKFKANHTNTGAATINVNSQGAKTIKKEGDKDVAAGDIKNGQIYKVIYDGTNFQLLSSVVTAPRLNIMILGNAGSAGPIETSNRGRWAQMFTDNTELHLRDAATATTLNYMTAPSSYSAVNSNETDRSGLTANADVGCMVKDGSTEYLVTAASGGTTLYRHDSDGQNETALTISGTSIGTGVTRMGYDFENDELLVMDAANKGGTTIRRYTLSGTTLTHQGNITLSAAPANAGATQMYVGNDHIVIEDDGGTDSPDFQRYNKSTGTKVDTITLNNSYSAKNDFYGLLVTSDNKLYMGEGGGAGDQGFVTYWLFDLE